jgi:hypothetical protein
MQKVGGQQGYQQAANPVQEDAPEMGSPAQRL